MIHTIFKDFAENVRESVLVGPKLERGKARRPHVAYIRPLNGKINFNAKNFKKMSNRF